MSPQKSKQDFVSALWFMRKNKDKIFLLMEAETSTQTTRNLQKLVCPYFCSSEMCDNTLMTIISETGGVTCLRTEKYYFVGSVTYKDKVP